SIQYHTSLPYKDNLSVTNKKLSIVPSGTNVEEYASFAQETLQNLLLEIDQLHPNKA
ncbi:hypothetical protein ACJX0J_028796, partial [Zea mays]